METYSRALWHAFTVSVVAGIGHLVWVSAVRCGALDICHMTMSTWTHVHNARSCMSGKLCRHKSCFPCMLRSGVTVLLALKSTGALQGLQAFSWLNPPQPRLNRLPAGAMSIQQHITRSALSIMIPFATFIIHSAFGKVSAENDASNDEHHKEPANKELLLEGEALEQG
eukprot:scaffold76713_cov17-Tisochrysis_lutea.AAC.3